MTENMLSVKKLGVVILLLLASSVLGGGCTSEKKEEPLKSQGNVIEHNAASSKQKDKVKIKEKTAAEQIQGKAERETIEKADGRETKELAEKQIPVPEEEPQEKAEPVEDEKVEKEAVTVPKLASCVISGKSYTDIPTDMPMAKVLKKIAERIPKLSSYVESSNSRYFCKEAGRRLPDQGCEVLWEFELRVAGGYDPDKYYLVRIKESNGHILAIEGGQGWEDAFPNASPNIVAAGIVQEPVPYDLLRLK